MKLLPLVLLPACATPTQGRVDPDIAIIEGYECEEMTLRKSESVDQANNQCGESLTYTVFCKKEKCFKEKIKDKGKKPPKRYACE